jgi:hypothetical protein
MVPVPVAPDLELESIPEEELPFIPLVPQAARTKAHATGMIHLDIRTP